MGANMDERQLRDILASGRENRRVEFKSAMRWSDSLAKAKITKAALALSNVRDGGYIVLGVTQSLPDNTLTLSGVPEEDSLAYTDDALKAHINEYADPFVDLAVHRVPLDGMLFIIIHVHEFAEVPVVCKKDGSDSLRRAAIYTRTRRMTESAPCPTQTEIREILDLALEKALRKQAALQMRIYGSAHAQPAPVDPYIKEREQFS
jgi:hypothetical protein